MMFRFNNPKAILKKTSFLRIILLTIQTLLASYTFGQTMTNAPLSLKGEISLPGVKGRIDHLAYNNKNGVIYVAALGNNSVEVADLKSRKVIHSIKGLDEPQGIRFIPGKNYIVVANGGSGELNIFDATTYKMIKSVKLGEDADNVRYDAVSKTIYAGYGSGKIAALSALTLDIISTIELPGHPESFQLNNENKIYVNIPTSHLLDVIDLKQNEIIGKWEIKVAASNFPMALDDANHRIFTGCRHPAKLLILDSKSGKLISNLTIDEDTDDLFYDSSSSLIYVSCGSGYLNVFKQLGPDNYEMLTKIKTAPGARTSLFIPETSQLIVAGPSRNGKETRLLIYSK